MKTNLWHRRIAIVSAIFLLISATTGLLWAYAIHTFLRLDYQVKKKTLPAPAFESVKLTPQDAIAKTASKESAAQSLEAVTLIPQGGKLVYLVERKEKKKKHAALVDAITGEKLSPLSDAYAAAIAAEYVGGATTVKKITAFDDYTHVSGKKLHNVKTVTFNEKDTPLIALDRDSGAIVDEVDGNRLFFFWVRKLHQLQFFGTKKELTAIPGLALLFLTITGSMILWRRYKPRKRPS